MRKAILSLLILAAAGIAAGCPGRPIYKPELRPAQADKYSEFGQSLRSEDGFKTAIKQLQERFVDPPDPGMAQPADSQSDWQLSSRVVDHEVRLDLTNGRGEVWGLGVFRLLNDLETPLTILKSAQTPGGFQLEAEAGHDAELSILLNARWVQGRYLELKRELVLNTQDSDRTLDPMAVALTLCGPAQPYCTLPSLAGPFGVRQDPIKDMVESYPQELLVPALASYDINGGMLMAVVDEHVRILSRNYDVGISAQAPSGGKDRLGWISSSVYDPTKDSYQPAYIVSGLPMRDMLVLEPLQFRVPGEGSNTVVAVTRQVFDHLGTLMQSFIAMPRAQAASDGVAVLMPEDWSKWLNETPLQLKVLINSKRVVCGVQELDEDWWLDLDALAAGVWEGGAGAVDLPPDGLLERIGVELDKDGLAVCTGWDMLHLDPAGPVAKLGKGEMLAGSAKLVAPEAKPKDKSTALQTDWINLRNADAAAWLTRTLSKRASARKFGIYWPDYLWQSFPVQPSDQGAFYGSYSAASVILELESATILAEAQPDLPQLMLGPPRACRPVFGPLCLLPVQGQAAASGAVSATTDSSSRLGVSLVHSLFGLRPYVGSGSRNLAELLLAMDLGTGGVVLNENLSSFSGFEGFLKNMDSAIASAGDMRVLLAETAAGADLASGLELPGGCARLAFMLPAEPAGDTAAFLGFLGVGGGITIDPYNLMTVSFDNGKTATYQLPPGIWQVENTDPAVIPAGDVAVISKRYLQPPDDGRGNSST